MRKVDKIIVAGEVVFDSTDDPSCLVIMPEGFDFSQLADGIEPDALEVFEKGRTVLGKTTKASVAGCLGAESFDCRYIEFQGSEFNAGSFMAGVSAEVLETIRAGILKDFTKSLGATMRATPDGSTRRVVIETTELPATA